MITVKLGELKGIIEGFQEIGELRLPAKVSYMLTKAGIKIMKEYQIFEEVRLKTARDLAMKDDKGEPLIQPGTDEKGNPTNQFQFTVLGLAQFQKEFSELCNKEIEVNAYPVAISQLGDIQVSVMGLMKLEKFIVDDQEVNPKLEAVN